MLPHLNTHSPLFEVWVPQVRIPIADLLFSLTRKFLFMHQYEHSIFEFVVLRQTGKNAGFARPSRQGEQLACHSLMPFLSRDTKRFFLEGVAFQRLHRLSSFYL